MSVRGEERSRKRCAVRDDEVCVRRTDDARIEIYIVYLFRKFYVSPSPDRTAHSHVFHLILLPCRYQPAELPFRRHRPLFW